MNKVQYIITLAFLALLGSFSAQDLETIDKISGVVGNEIILKSEVAIQGIQRSNGLLPTDAVKSQVMEELLFQKLLVNQAKVDSIEVTDAEIQSEIEKRLEYYVSQLGSEEAFVSYYKKSISQWKSEFEEPIEKQLLADKMQRTLFGNIKITPGEVLDFYNSLPNDSLPLINSTVEFSQIVMKPMVKEAEKDRTRLFLDSIRNGLATGKILSFSLEAAKWSEDPGSKYKGGCYDLQRRGSFVPEYEAAVYNTPEGGYSPVFETTYGYHFVYVEEKRGEMYKACHILMSPKTTGIDLEKAKTKLDSVYNLLQADSLDFTLAAKRFSTDEATRNQDGKVISLSSGSSKMEIDEIPPTTYFILDKIEVGHVSEPSLVDLRDGTKAWVIYKVTNRTEAHQANLKDDYLIFSQQAEAINRQEMLQTWVSKTLGKTYVWLDDDVKDLNYQYDWLKNDRFK